MENSQWYDERLPGLGDQLVDEVQAVLARIEATPAAFARYEFYRGSAEVRRSLLSRFPISVIFLVESDGIVILAFAAQRRRPLYWLGRLRDHRRQTGK